ncbi:nucleotide exchange factor GrpE [bacterium]|nr:nucleotide exchange factor GrpE [bacterium]
MTEKKKKKEKILKFKKNVQETSPECDPTEIPEPEIKKLSELEEAQEKARDYLDSLQRLKAEFDNYRKRMAKDRQKVAEFHQSIVLEAILPTLDSFDAALPNNGSSDDDKIYEGLKLIYDGLKTSLNKLGFQKVDVLGKPFDPEIAEALMTQPCEDEEPDTIVGVIATGYSFKGRILRPARVVVSSSPESDETAIFDDADVELTNGESHDDV